MTFIESLAIVAGGVFAILAIFPAISFAADLIDDIADDNHRRRLKRMNRRHAIHRTAERIHHP